VTQAARFLFTHRSRTSLHHVFRVELSTEFPPKAREEIEAIGWFNPVKITILRPHRRRGPCSSLRELFNRKRDGTALNARKPTGIAMAIVPPVEPTTRT
jgi:hypothetical protein